MKILIAEDDAASRLLIENTLTNWGYEVMVARNGIEAWEAFQGENTPQLAVLDWMMPGLDGVQICRKVRAELKPNSCYILLLTARNRNEEVAEGLDSGADDYLIKPCDPIELEARLRVGFRVLELQSRLVARVTKDSRFNALTQTVRALVPHIRQAIDPVVREVDEFQSSPGNDGQPLVEAARSGTLRIQAIADALADMAIFGAEPGVGNFNGPPDSPGSWEALIRHFENRRRRGPDLVEGPGDEGPVP
jgi:CheY-like chemotaxis protein